MKNSAKEKVINVTLDYYGNQDYGKRVFWIQNTHNYVWGEEFVAWHKMMREDGFKVVITNEDEVSKSILKAIKK